MTIDDPVDQLGKDTHPQQQQTAFEVVLVDIEKTLKNNVIHCVKRPLEEKDLKFVALSYRWGELHETMIDTKVGYTASITSFSLDDFYDLCYTMTRESNLKHIKYVWVDAICVDQRPAKRKATIYQMSNIYDKATYILAVPDLHLAHLKAVSIKNNDTILGSKEYIKDIYHLIHGNTSQLAALEEKFLDDAHVPNEPPALRLLLLQYTDHFAHSFMTYQKHADHYCPVRALDHICDINRKGHQGHWRAWIKGKSSNSSIGDLHQCNEALCPLESFCQSMPSKDILEELGQFDQSNWKGKIIQRSTSIRQSMEFLADLVKDWSSRVWVISEFNIAKKKNNLMFWFTQFGSFLDRTHFKDDFTFFKFDFNDSDAMLNTPYYENQYDSFITRSYSSNPVYILFHYTMIHQLRQQTFLEMILSSKASRNEDRFYSTLPLSEYADKKSEVSQWDIYNMASVKLKLYDIMTIQDKLTLLFWSSARSAGNYGVLPTFATSVLSLQFQMKDILQALSLDLCNFDLNDPSTMMLYDQPANKNGEATDENDSDTKRYYLRLKPKEYKVTKSNPLDTRRTDFLAICIPALTQLLGIKEASTTHPLDIVSIPAIRRRHQEGSLEREEHFQSHFITLVGSFASNTWIMARESITDYYPQHVKGTRVVVGDDGHDRNTKSTATFFNIY